MKLKTLDRGVPLVLFGYYEDFGRFPRFLDISSVLGVHPGKFGGVFECFRAFKDIFWVVWHS